MALVAPELAARLVRLEPLDTAHVEDLVAASAEDREAYRFAAVPRGRAEMADLVQGYLAAGLAGEAISFAQVRVADGRSVGITRYLNLRMRPGRDLPYAVEIGGTWLAASGQRTGINPEAKRLLLAHAFEDWSVERVDLKTDARNSRSRAAITRLGARFEGILRNWQPSQAEGEEGQLRHTAMYSILDSEWPEVRDALTARSA